MIWFLLILIILVFVLQLHMADTALDRLHCSVRTPDYLTEPDAPFRLVITLENHSRLPVFFLRFQMALPIRASLVPGSPGTAVAYVNTGAYMYDCFLLPRQKREITIRLTLPDRGGYRFSGYQLSAGDFLGIRENAMPYPGSCSVVILPRQPKNRMDPQVLGGLIGERTVRRWIHEDPILSAGYREYTGREPLKTISWNRSLQSGSLMVRQMDHTAEEKVTVLLGTEGGTAEQLEGCLRICRAVAELLEARRLPFAFLHSGILMTSFGTLPPLEAGLGTAHLTRILEGLGRAQLFAAGSLDGLIQKAIARSNDSCCYLLIVPQMNAQVRRLAAKLENHTGSTVEVLCGEDDL